MNAADLIVPGLLNCPKCGFTLSKNILCPAGVFAEVSNKIEYCPNHPGDPVKMEHVTWQKYAKDMATTAESFMIKFREAEKELAALQFRKPYDTYWSKRTLAAEKLLRKVNDVAFAERMVNDFRAIGAIDATFQMVQEKPDFWTKLASALAMVKQHLEYVDAETGAPK